MGTESQKNRKTGSSKKSKKSNKKQLKTLKGILLFGWILFILLLVAFGVILLHNSKGNVDSDSDIIADEDEQFTSKYIYETNQNLEINALVISYLSSMTSCDQNSLKTLVTDPTDYDDMTKWINTAKYIKGYSNIDCYTVAGNTDDLTIVYIVSNIYIDGVTSSPKDIIRLLVRNVNGNYLIDNTNQNDETKEYIAEIEANPDVAALFKTVNDDINKCYENDETFRQFYQEINPN